MRRWPRRFADALFEDPTRQLQIGSVLAGYLVGLWLIGYQTPTDLKTARAVFYFFDEHSFALVLFVTSGLQLGAVAGPWWRLRFAAASIKSTVWVYATICYLLTNPDALSVPLLMALCVQEFWVSARALHDRGLNGADRRVAE